MDKYFAAINQYRVQMGFNVPLAHAPQGHPIELERNDIIFAIEGNVYVEMDSKQRELCGKSNDNYVQALFDEKFVTLNPKIFKLI